MYKHKLISLLKSCSRKEMTRFLAFSESPYFNKHTGVRQLVHYFSSIYPRFTDRNCHRTVLAHKLGETSKNIPILFTYTTRLFEQFLVQETLQQEAILQEVMLLRSLREREQFRFYEKYLRRTKLQLDQLEIKDTNYYNGHYLLAQESDSFFLQHQKRQKDSNLQQKNHFLDRYFLLEKLKDACELRIRSKILKIDYEAPLLAKLITFMQEEGGRFESEPMIRIYYPLYQMIHTSLPEYYFDALTLFRANFHHFSLAEAKQVYNYFQNFCIEQINRGEEQFLEEIFKLYKLQLEEGLLLEKGVLSEWHYKNIVTTALRLNELDWVDQFLGDYKSLLLPTAQENAYTYNRAAYFHASEQYEKVLDLLIKVEYIDLRYSLGAKALLLKTYFEMKEYEALFSLIDSFRQYLLRNKLMADSRREGYWNLFKLTRRLAQLKANQAYISQVKYEKDYHRLLEEIGKTKAIFNKRWLMQQLSSER